MGLSPTLPPRGIMSGIDFKSFLIGILIAIIFVFTTGISLSGGGKYMVKCGSFCLVLNTETGAGRFFDPEAYGRNKVLKAGVKPDF